MSIQAVTWVVLNPGAAVAAGTGIAATLAAGAGLLARRGGAQRR